MAVPNAAIKGFFRYEMRLREGGASGNTLADWDRIYSFNFTTFPDTDGDGIPDYLETAMGTNANDILSYPWKVVRTDPFDKQAGHPRDGAVLVYLNRPLPSSMTTVTPDFVRHLIHLGDTDPSVPPYLLDVLSAATVAPGSAMILPGRKVVAFLPSPNLEAGSNHTVVNNYKIDFTTGVTGLAQLLPFHSEFATVDTFDEVGPWVKLVRPGETAIEVAADFAPVIEWSQPLLPATLVNTNVSVAQQVSGTPLAVSVAFDYETNLMTLAHTTAFLPDTVYTVTLGTGFKNLVGKPLLNAFTWSFRTRPLRPVAVVGQGPYVTAVAPGDFATSVDVMTTGEINVTFSEAMDASTLTAATVHLRPSGAAVDADGTFAYDPPTRRLSFTPSGPLGYATRYELTLEAGAILSSASPPKALQGPAAFVFTTAQYPFAGGDIAGTGGMGGPGSGPAGGSGTPDPEQPAPLQLQLAYGDDDGDAGASVKLEITLPDGSQRGQQMPNATHGLAHHLSPEIPPGSTVVVTPQLLKGDDPDYQEELEEVAVEVSGMGTAADADYAVFGQSDTPGSAGAPAAAGAWDFFDALVAGQFVAQVKNNGKLAVGRAGFQLRNDSDVTKGWDSTGADKWTSVGVGQQNTLVKAVLPVDVNSANYELVVNPGDESKISLQNNTITGRVTNFTIVGGTANRQVDIVLRKKGATPTVIATLHVLCFAPRVAKIGVYRVFDSTNVNTQAPDQGIMADNATIVADLNQTFGLQAGVTFAVDASSRRVDMKDTNVFNADGSIDVSFNNGVHLNTIAGVTAILVSQDNKPLPKLRLYLVQSLNGTVEAYGGLTKTNTDLNVNPGSAFANCFVNRSQPSATVRHEVGHGLGLSQQKQGQASSHDNGKWPVELRPSTGNPKPAGLMNDSENGRAWLRNNDWDWANKTGHYYE